MPKLARDDPNFVEGPPCPLGGGFLFSGRFRRFTVSFPHLHTCSQTRTLGVSCVLSRCFGFWLVANAVLVSPAQGPTVAPLNNISRVAGHFTCGRKKKVETGETELRQLWSSVS